MEELGWFREVDTTGLSGGEGGSVCPLIIRDVIYATNTELTSHSDGERILS